MASRKRQCKSVNGSRQQARQIWQEHFGYIPPHHFIHHKDNNPFNNNIDNLMCVDRRIHPKFHAVARRRKMGRNAIRKLPEEDLVFLEYLNRGQIPQEDLEFIAYTKYGHEEEKFTIKEGKRILKKMYGGNK